MTSGEAGVAWSPVTQTIARVASSARASSSASSYSIAACLASGSFA
jgi:hypothetical protein